MGSYVGKEPGGVWFAQDAAGYTFTPFLSVIEKYLDAAAV